MKKLFILILANLFCLGLFAVAPKVPKMVNYSDTDPYLYISNDCLNMYRIIANVHSDKKSSNYQLSFINYSLVIDTLISIQINFSSEQQLDNYIKDIDLSDLESEFKKLRQSLIKNNCTPDIYPAINSDLEKINIDKEYRKNHPFGYGYEEIYDNENIPNGIYYNVTISQSR